MLHFTRAHGSTKSTSSNPNIYPSPVLTASRWCPSVDLYIFPARLYCYLFQLDISISDDLSTSLTPMVVYLLSSNVLQSGHHLYSVTSVFFLKISPNHFRPLKPTPSKIKTHNKCLVDDNLSPGADCAIMVPQCRSRYR